MSGAICRNPSCKVGEIIKDQYGAESEEDFKAREASGFCRSKCKRLTGPLPKDRPTPPLSPVSWHTERTEGVAVPKEVPDRDAARLAYARSLPCCYCGATEGVHGHHENELGKGTMAGKTSDRRSVPLCWHCHYLRHEKGRSFWGNMDVEMIITQINEAFDNRRR